MTDTDKSPSNFIKHKIDADIAAGKVKAVVTRFPPEPNGYLHIGHAKSICLNFGLAQQYSGTCSLRYDDTNPSKEEQEYVDAILADLKWLGFDPRRHVYYASDYFQQLYDWALQLIRAGKAYVDHQTAEQIHDSRGTLTQPGQPSPYRDRSVEENLALFEKMKQGEFAEGECVLRAKIDMAAPNVNLRDPAMYRIRKASHHRTGDKWCIYPMYDWAHGQSDAIEKVSHSLCTLEFEDHRPLYDWFLDALALTPRPEQTEFARLNLTYTVLSKRKLSELVEGNHVSGWDDPRMPTLSGLRRRGVTPEAIRDFCDRIGVARANSTVDYALFANCIREDLNKRTERRMAIFDPIKLVIVNYPEGKTEWLEAENNPEDPQAGKRKIPFGRELYIERDDFREEAPKKWHRLAPGQEVRLLHAYYVTCSAVYKDADGHVTEVHCTYDADTKGGWSADGRKVKGTIHWVAKEHATLHEVRLYEHLFQVEDPNVVAEGQNYLDRLNPDSLKIAPRVFMEPGLRQAKYEERFQFVRNGYYFVDPKESLPGQPVFNRVIALRDSWAKEENKS